MTVIPDSRQRRARTVLAQGLEREAFMRRVCRRRQGRRLEAVAAARTSSTTISAAAADDTAGTNTVLVWYQREGLPVRVERDDVPPPGERPLPRTSALILFRLQQINRRLAGTAGIQLRAENRGFDGSRASERGIGAAVRA